MTCAEFEDLVEAVVAGDVPESDEFRAHRETCRRCAHAYAAAVAIERGLAARPVAAPPARFTATVLMRIRSERWRADQQVDRAFNVAVVAGVLGMFVGGIALLNLGSVTASIVSMASMTATAVSGSRAGGVEALPLWAYGLGAALLAMSAVIWRWAETARPQSQRVRL